MSVNFLQFKKKERTFSNSIYKDNIVDTKLENLKMKYFPPK